MLSNKKNPSNTTERFQLAYYFGGLGDMAQDSVFNNVTPDISRVLQSGKRRGPMELSWSECALNFCQGHSC